jgi:hypothetical protein
MAAIEQQLEEIEATKQTLAAADPENERKLYRELMAAAREVREAEAAARARYEQTSQNYAEARDGALSQLTAVTAAIAAAVAARAELEAAHSDLARLGVELGEPRPPKASVLAHRDRDVRRIFEDLRAAIWRDF